jgi:hypothetical protein
MKVFITDSDLVNLQETVEEFLIDQYGFIKNKEIKSEQGYHGYYFWQE